MLVRFHSGGWVNVDSDVHGTVYSFPSVRGLAHVKVAVPSDAFMFNAVTTALRAANAGIRLPGQSRVCRIGIDTRRPSGGG